MASLDPSQNTNLEFIWIMGSGPTLRLASQQIPIKGFSGQLDDCPEFELSRDHDHGEAKGKMVKLRAVFICQDPDQAENFLVMAEK